MSQHFNDIPVLEFRIRHMGKEIIHQLAVNSDTIIDSVKKAFDDILEEGTLNEIIKRELQNELSKTVRTTIDSSAYATNKEFSDLFREATVTALRKYLENNDEVNNSKR